MHCMVIYIVIKSWLKWLKYLTDSTAKLVTEKGPVITITITSHLLIYITGTIIANPHKSKALGDTSTTFASTYGYCDFMARFYGRTFEPSKFAN